MMTYFVRSCFFTHIQHKTGISRSQFMCHIGKYYKDTQMKWHSAPCNNFEKYSANIFCDHNDSLLFRTMPSESWYFFF